MEITTITWVALGLIFVLFLIASVIIMTYSKGRDAHTDAIYSKQTSTKTSFWKVVKGSIEDSSLDYRDHKRFLRSTIRQYRARITYQYFAFDRKYQHSIPITDWQNDKEAVSQLLEQHNTGQAIIVRFHPEQPESSIVEINN